ncbi:hypothetical protein L2E82_45875 [Cichorium intybus]|uniref:Uncharacterized protein n=1 Tax=Cichorium intybus TaxID=13427 RepID=A0ACB8ZU30_CICIN|nr:hypothetical protein L2E82_45875 [Cichorium intybus]
MQPECSAGDGVREAVAGLMHLRIQPNVDEALGYGVGEAVAGIAGDAVRWMRCRRSFNDEEEMLDAQMRMDRDVRGG